MSSPKSPVRRFSKFYTAVLVILVFALAIPTAMVALGVSGPGLVAAETALIVALAAVTVIGIATLVVVASLRPATQTIAVELEHQAKAQENDKAELLHVAEKHAQEAIAEYDGAFRSQLAEQKESYEALDDWARERIQPVLDAPEAAAKIAIQRTEGLVAAEREAYESRIAELNEVIAELRSEQHSADANAQERIEAVRIRADQARDEIEAHATATDSRFDAMKAEMDAHMAESEREFARRIAAAEEAARKAQADAARANDKERRLEIQTAALAENSGNLSGRQAQAVEKQVQQALDARFGRFAKEQEGELQAWLDAAQERIDAAADMKLSDAQQQAIAAIAQQRLDKRLDKLHKELLSDMSEHAARLRAEMDDLTHAELPEPQKTEIAKKAIDHVDHRFEEHQVKMDDALDAYAEWLDEQFALFLLGQQSERLSLEHRVADMVNVGHSSEALGFPQRDVSDRSPFGQVYPVVDVEGIGNKTAYALQRMGILDTEHLWHADAQKVAAALDIVPEAVHAWQDMAELMSIKGIASQYAELLVSCGVHSIEQLAGMDARKLWRKVSVLQHDRSIQRGKLGEGTVARWIEHARGHHPEQHTYV